VEHQSQTALAQWFRTRGRQEIYSKGKKVDLEQPRHSPRAELVQIGSKTDLE
jgi:hypothetical protein